MNLAEAIKKFVKPGYSIFFSGMQHGEPAAAIREIVRQRINRLTIFPVLTTLAGLLIGEGLVTKIAFAYVSDLFEKKFGYPIIKAKESRHYPQLVEYSHFALSLGLLAGQMGVPYLPMRVLVGSGLERHNPNIIRTQCPFSGETLGAVKAIRPDVGILHAQQCDELGNAQKFGSLGMDKTGINASRSIIVTTEKIIPTSEIRKGPNSTITPAFRVNAVVEIPWGAYPVHLAGCYEGDISEFRNSLATKDSYEHYLERFVYGVKDHAAFLERVKAFRGEDIFSKLKITDRDD